jgi:hypothetical protein
MQRALAGKSVRVLRHAPLPPRIGRNNYPEKIERAIAVREFACVDDENGFNRQPGRRPANRAIPGSGTSFGQRWPVQPS